MKKVKPFGNFILVEKLKVGEKIGKENIIIATDVTQDTNTDIATIVDMPDHTFCDKLLIKQSAGMIDGLINSVKEGSGKAMESLIMFNAYLRHKSLLVGDKIYIRKYGGSVWGSGSGDEQFLIDRDDVLGLVIDE